MNKKPLIALWNFLWPFIRPKPGYWIARILVSSGCGLLVFIRWWEPLLESFLRKQFEVENPIPEQFIGIALIVAGIAVYIFEKRSEKKQQTMLRVLAHFAYPNMQPPRTIYIKIHNPPGCTKNRITHVTYRGSADVPVLTRPLPRDLDSPGGFETMIPVDSLPDPESDEMLTRFFVTDCNGDKFQSEPNLDVDSVGYVEQ